MAGRDGRRKPIARRPTSFRAVALLMLLPFGGLLAFFGWQFLHSRHAAPAGPAGPAARAETPLREAVSRSGIDIVHVEAMGRSAVVETRTDLRTVASKLRLLIPASRIDVRPDQVTVSDDREGIAIRRVAPVDAAAPPAAAAPSRAAGPPRVVLILDDVGFDHQEVDQAMGIDPNLNFAVIPNGVRAAETARRLHQAGFEVLCHMPMEPEGYPDVSPGSGAILTSMSDAQIRAAALANLESVPFARGVNNHMGSRATADVRVMRGVLEALPHGTYFIDSRTTSSSRAEEIARALHVPTAARNVFLDDVQSEPAIRKQLSELVAVADRNGVAIGIGHIYPVTVKVLRDEVPGLRSRGIRFMRASEVVN
jgi:uncharacterized protein